MWSNILFSCKSHSRRGSSEFLFLSLCIWLLSTEKADFFAEREIKNFLVVCQSKIFQTCLIIVIAVLFLFLTCSLEQSDRKYLAGLYFLRSF